MEYFDRPFAPIVFMSQPLRIGIESTVQLNHNPTGIARMARGLLQGFSELSAEDPSISVAALYKLSRWRRSSAMPEISGQDKQLWHNLQPPMMRRFDVVHATWRWLPNWSAPLRVATIPDTYAAVGVNAANPEDVRRQMRILDELARGAHHVICISSQTRTDFLKHFGFDAACAHVVHLGVEKRFLDARSTRSQEIRERYSGGESYLFFLGYFSANKNIERLLAAYARSPVRHRYRLLLGGAPASGVAAKLDTLLRELGIADRVSTPGYLNDDEVPDFYGAASGFMFPSTYEGFGLPILEAMASGTPVMTSTTASCPEVANGHAVLVDPYSIDDMVRGIEDCVTMSQDRIEAARRYASTKTWLETARQTVAVYRSAISSGPMNKVPTIPTVS